MSSLSERMLKTTAMKGRAEVLTESKLFEEKELVSTPIPMLNVALSGSVDGGLGSGLTMIAGPSRHFKCLGKDTLIDVWVDLKKVTMSMRELCYLLSNGQIDSLPNEGINSVKDAYVKTPTGELARVNQVIKKTNVEMIDVETDIDTITCAKTHGFIDENYNDVYAKDAETLRTVGGTCKVISTTDSKETEAYDISIDAPHLYQTNNGVIHHNTLFGLVQTAAYMKAKPDAICLFYDSEFGAGKDYFESVGVPIERVIHIPIMNIEELKFDLVQKLEEITKKDNIIVFIDSVGNLASKKEIDDAKDEKSVADMTRAKQMKSLWRMVTPYLTMKDIPLIAISHTYETMEMFSKQVVSGGCVTEGTPILLANGTPVAIEDVCVDDMVMTKNGFNKVTATWNPETLENGTPECFEITFEDGSVYTVSDKHKFLVNGKWVEAQNLDCSMDVEMVDEVSKNQKQFDNCKQRSLYENKQD